MNSPQVKKLELDQVYNQASYSSLTDGDHRYLGSLTPLWSKLKGVRKIDFKLTLETPSRLTSIIKEPHENEVNSHIFKPIYYRNEKDSFLCYVANEQILAHTIKALRVATKEIKNEKVHLKIANFNDTYSKYTLDWKIEDLVILCRVESFITFLKIIWLQQLQVAPTLIEQYAISCDLQRIDLNIKIEELEKEIEYKFPKVKFNKFKDFYKIQHQPTHSQYISSVNLQYKGEKISLIQLTWGIGMAESQIKVILNKNPAIKHIGIIGGVGYSNANHGVKVDDIFIPNSIVLSDVKNSHSLHPIENLVATQENIFFKNQNVINGSIKTVVPTLGRFSNTSVFKDSLHMISGFDMEIEGFLKVLTKRPDIKKSLAYYVMDLPFDGIGLGDTYYHLPFLKNLFSNFNRGKYYCFEKILASII